MEGNASRPNIKKMAICIIQVMPSKKWTREGFVQNLTVAQHNAHDIDA